MQRRSTGDEPGARVALGLALRVDPEYVFARLLHQACNEGLDPEALRSCLRTDRGTRASSGTRRGGARPHRSRPQQVRPATRKPATGKKEHPSAGTRPGGTAAGNRSRARRRSGQRGTRSGR
ncbi:DUF4192 family protein [Streptomyces sp. NPDC060064]|uniref:DUF4192 family protein n=1 Tax=Streptomyces sp. NPDC060064 TaxID=3347049 RepID=UPI0036B9DF67